MNLAANNDSPVSRRDWLPIGLLLLAIALLYSSPVTATSLFADEQSWMAPPPPGSWAWSLDLAHYGQTASGRFLGGYLNHVGLGYLSLDLGNLHWLRVLSCVLSALNAALLYWMLRKLGARGWMAFAVVLGLWSHPAIQMMHLFWPFIPTLVALAVSLGAAYVLLEVEWKQRWHFALALLAIAAGLGAGHNIIQIHPFAGACVGAYAVLKAPTGATLARRLRGAAIFGGLVVLTLAINTAIHKLFTDTSEMYYNAKNGYEGLASLSAFIGRLAPDRYIHAFEFWNYPFAVFIAMEDLNKILRGVGLLWVCAVLVFAARAIRREGKDGAYRWICVILLLGTTFIPAAADGSDRHHLVLPAAMTLATVTLYMMERIWGAMSSLLARRVVVAVLTGVLLWSVAGAYLQIERKIVGPRDALFRHVMAQLAATPAGVVNGIELISACHAQPNAVERGLCERTCVLQPCKGYYQSSYVCSDWRYFHFALATIGRNSPSWGDVQFVAKPTPSRPGIGVVDLTPLLQ